MLSHGDIFSGTIGGLRVLTRHFQRVIPETSLCLALGMGSALRKIA